MSKFKEVVKVEPVPPGHHARLGGHHWLQEVDFDGRVCDTVVYQWNPGVQRWSHSGEIGTGYYMETKGWKYLQPCPMPGDYIPTRQMEIRDFHILSDAQTAFHPIDGLCQFKYKGYQISISTSGLSKGACQTPVCVYSGEDFQQVAKDGFHTVEEAIDWINNPNKE